MKRFLIISILLLNIACKKNYTPALSSQVSINNYINKPLQRFLNNFETICPIDSFALNNLEGWRKYLNQCVTADSSFSENIPAGTYSTRIQFEVSTTGKAINQKIIIDPGYGLAQKALEIFNSYNGKWPLILQEENIKVYIQPVTFEIVDE